MFECQNFTFVHGLATVFRLVLQYSVYIATIIVTIMLTIKSISFPIVQNYGGVKLWRIDCFGEKNVSKFIIANISYFSNLEFG